jgi:hypothetical protein
MDGTERSDLAGQPGPRPETLCSSILHPPCFLSFSLLACRLFQNVAVLVSRLCDGYKLFTYVLLLAGHRLLPLQVLSVVQSRCDDGSTDNIRRNTRVGFARVSVKRSIARPPPSPARGTASDRLYLDGSMLRRRFLGSISLID